MTKKEKIEQTAEELFLKHGFKKVSIDEICKKAHVSRKTYYTYYSNKNALVMYILGNIMDQGIRKYETVVEGEGSFTEKLIQMIDFKYEFSKTITKEFVADFFDLESGELLVYWKKMVDLSLQMFVDFLRAGQQAGEINPDLKIEYVLWLFQHLMEVIYKPELLEMFDSAEDLVRQLTESLIYGIMPVRK